MNESMTPDRSRGRWIRWVLAAALLNTAGAPAFPQQLSLEDGLEELVVLAERTPVDSSALSRHLAELGPEALLPLTVALAEEQLPASWSGTTRPRGLASTLASELRRALAALPKAVLRRHLRELAQEDVPASALVFGVQLLGDFGGRQDLGLLLELGDAGVAAGSRDELTKAYESSLLRILARNRDALEEIVFSFPATPDALLDATVTSLGALSSHAALDCLSGLLGAHPRGTARVLAEIARLGSRLRHPVPPTVCHRVRLWLEQDDELLKVLTADALGALGDIESIPRLMEYLDEWPGARTPAAKALRAIAGVSRAGRPESWRTWYADELDWWEGEAQRQFTQLRSLDPAVVFNAVRLVVPHRWRRHEVASELVVVLDRPEFELVSIACKGLAHLGSPVAVSELIELLEHEDAAVRRGSSRGSDDPHLAQAPAHRPRMEAL